MNSILVSGGAGFIGSCFVRQLLAQGDCEVVNLDKLTYAADLEALRDVRHDPRHHFVQGDIADRELVSGLLQRHRPIAIVNLAAESHVDRSIDAPLVFAQNNVLGSVALLDVALHYWRAMPEDRKSRFRFVQVSTDEVYGSLAEGAFTEESRFEPSSPYAASKAAADHFVRVYGVTYGLPVLVTHSANNYGPFQHAEKLIPLMTLHAFHGKPLPLYGDGLFVRNWLHVSDHCRGIVRVLQDGQPGERYNIGGSCELTNLQVVSWICEFVDELCPQLPHLPSESLLRHVEDRLGHDRRYALDSSKIQDQLGWRPEYDFRQGLRETVAWYVGRQQMPQQSS